jgi:hypothetical protein
VEAAQSRENASPHLCVTYGKVTMPRCTNKWGTPNRRDRRSGRTGSISITKHAQMDTQKCVRSDNGENRSCSAEGSHPPEPEETPDAFPPFVKANVTHEMGS